MANFVENKAAITDVPWCLINHEGLRKHNAPIETSEVWIDSTWLVGHNHAKGLSRGGTIRM